jgi:hypothetical protein
MKARSLIPPPASVSEWWGPRRAKLALEVDASETSVGVGVEESGPPPWPRLCLGSASAFPPHRFAGGGINLDLTISITSHDNQPYAIAYVCGEVAALGECGGRGPDFDIAGYRVLPRARNIAVLAYRDDDSSFARSRAIKSCAATLAAMMLGCLPLISGNPIGQTSRAICCSERPSCLA